MNLYLFDDNDCASIYGIGTYLKEITGALENTDIYVHVVHLHSVHEEFVIEDKNQVEHWYIPEVRNYKTVSGSAKKVDDYIRNVSYLLRLHIIDTKDLVFHFNYNLSQLLAKELKAKFNCKTVATVHYLKWALDFHGNLNMLHTLQLKPEDQRNATEKMVLRTEEYEVRLYNEVDHLIILSEYTAALLCNEYQIDPGKITVIPNGLGDIIKEISIDRDKLRKKWRISENEYVLLFSGRLHNGKGLSFLIKAFHNVLEKSPNCRLMIVGSGDYTMYLKETKDICAKVTFTGIVEKKELEELYQIADIGMLPSLTEQCSYVIIEMMMHGLPIITTNAPGPAEMTIDGESSLQCPLIINQDSVKIDTDLLAEKIISLLQNPEERRRLGINARKRYEKIYSRDVFRKNMLNFYQSLYE